MCCPQTTYCCNYAFAAHLLTEWECAYGLPKKFPPPHRLPQVSKSNHNKSLSSERNNPTVNNQLLMYVLCSISFIFLLSLATIQQMKMPEPERGWPKKKKKILHISINSHTYVEPKSTFDFNHLNKNLRQFLLLHLLIFLFLICNIINMATVFNVI